MTTVAVAIRPASEVDVLGMANVFVEAWRSGYRGLVPDDVIDALDAPSVAADLMPGFAESDRTTVVAVDESGAVVGFARFGSDRDPETAACAGERPAGYLASLYVHPGASGYGVGRRLLHFVLDAMPKADMTLWVFAGNDRAIRLYERAGFRPDGASLTDPRWRTPQVRYHRTAPS